MVTKLSKRCLLFQYLLKLLYFSLDFTYFRVLKNLFTYLFCFKITRTFDFTQNECTHLTFRIPDSECATESQMVYSKFGGWALRDDHAMEFSGCYGNKEVVTVRLEWGEIDKMWTKFWNDVGITENVENLKKKLKNVEKF